MSSAARRPSPPADRTAGRRGRRALLAAAGIALALILAWWSGWPPRAIDPRVAEIQRARSELAAKYRADGGPTTLTEATAMMTAMNDLRAKIDALPENLRPQAERGGGNTFRTAMRARIEAYFSAPPEKRQAVLDRQIDQEEMMRKAYEAAQAVRAAVAGAAGAAAPPGGPPRGGSEEERNRFRKGIIDRTSPAERARYVEYRRMVDERREKRGLPPTPWGR